MNRMPCTIQSRKQGMMNLPGTLVLIAALALLAGCAEDPWTDSVYASPAELARIRTIAVLPSPESEMYFLTNGGDYNLPDNMLPSLVAAGDQRTLLGGEERLTKLANQKRGTEAELLAADIAARLTRMGYEARVEHISWPATWEHPMPDFGKISLDADAVMVVRPTRVSFLAPSIDSAYVLKIYAVATLFGKDRKQVLYQELHVCCDASAALPRFDDYDAMMSRPGRVADALAGVASGVGAAVAQDLKR